jgi:hypothetical protein
MHNLFLVYFVNLYMFRAYLGPSSGSTTVCTVYNNWYLFFFSVDYLLVGSITGWIGTKNKLCIKLVFFHDYIKMHGQQNIKPLCLLIAA